MPRSFLIKKKSTGSVENINRDNEVPSEYNATRVDYCNNSLQLIHYNRHSSPDDDQEISRHHLHSKPADIRSGDKPETTDKNGNKKTTDDAPKTVLPVVRRPAIWSPAADIKAEVDAAAAAAEMAVKLMKHAEALAPFPPPSSQCAPRNGIGTN